MKPILKIVPLVAVAALVATPSFAKSKKHVRHYSHSQMVRGAYGYDAPQRPVYSYVNGRMIGRSNDPNIAYQMRNDDTLKYR